MPPPRHLANALALLAAHGGVSSLTFIVASASAAGTRPTAQGKRGLPAFVAGPIMAYALIGDKLPARFKIANWGENEVRQPSGPTRKFVVNDVTVATMPKLHDSLGYDLVPLDYEHKSFPGSPNYDEHAPVAGHVTIEVVPNDGVYAVVDAYTPDGQKHAANFADVSGVFYPNDKGELIAVESVALTQRGAIRKMRFKDAPALAAAIAASLTALETGDADITDLARQVLGYDDTATPDDIRDGLQAIVAQRLREAEARQMQDAPTTSPTANSSKTTQPKTTTTMTDAEIKAAITEGNKDTLDAIKVIAASVGDLAKIVTPMVNANAIAASNQAVEVLLTEATQAGKVIPASVKAKTDAGAYKMDAETVKDVLASIPATVKTQFNGGTVAPTTATSNSSDEAVVRAALGMSEEEFKKPGIRAAMEPAKTGSLVG